MRIVVHSRFDLASMPQPLLLAVADALAFVEAQGVVLASAKGPVPRLIDAIVGKVIHGNWWTHAEARRIYAVLNAVSASDQVLVCRLVEGHITLVHRRLWPALARMATSGLLPPERVAQVQEEHTASGRHVSRDVPLEAWLPPDVRLLAETLGDEDARDQVGRFIPLQAPRTSRTQRSSVRGSAATKPRPK